MLQNRRWLQKQETRCTHKDDKLDKRTRRLPHATLSSRKGTESLIFTDVFLYNKIYTYLIIYKDIFTKCKMMWQLFTLGHSTISTELNSIVGKANDVRINGEMRKWILSQENSEQNRESHVRRGKTGGTKNRDAAKKTDDDGASFRDGKN